MALKIPFSPPDITELEIEQVAEALRSGWITTGPKTKELERQVAAFCGTNKAVCLNSQTACAEMALHILGVGSGDEVIVPAYTYTATASVVCHVGATLVMIDTQPDSLEMDYEQLSQLSQKNQGNYSCGLSRNPWITIRSFDRGRKEFVCANNDVQRAMGRISVNADAAHAFGAVWHGQRIGGVADFSSFSFHAVKNLTTAEGGALTWRTILYGRRGDISSVTAVFFARTIQRCASQNAAWCMGI
ncbi:MAG: DegT/DnrJ/EryC1/StrS family aminotransferase [Hydrogeniiclostridium mannosilyticum]